MTETSSEPLLLLGDCLDRLREMPDNSVDSVVTDPPYGLSFMGKKWDYDVPSEEIWRECLRVLKPGGHLLAFAGTRTQHRMAVRIEDAGFEIRDMIAWVYGSGFPKSLDVSKAIDKAAGVEREVVGARIDSDGRSRRSEPNGGGSTGFSGELNVSPVITAPATEAAQQWQGWGTALKPALEPITVARKPLGEKTVAANVLVHGTGAINVDGCRIPGIKPQVTQGINTNASSFNVAKERRISGEPNEGRWPSNLIHDGSDEVVGLFPESKSTPFVAKHTNKIELNCQMMVSQEYAPNGGFADTGSAARFFYCAKASKKDRDEGLERFEQKQTAAMQGNLVSGQRVAGDGTPIATPVRANTHPTVKPTALMRYLCRLVTPPEGIVLDPFMGSGSTGKAAILEGFQFIGIERDEEYMEIAKARISAASNEHA